MFAMMMRHICPGLLLLAAVAANAGDDRIDITTGDWDYNSQVQKIAETPQGILFRIEPTLKPRLHLENCNCELCDSNPKVNGLLNFSFLKNKEINRRYVVIDFTARTSPAFENEASPAFSFSILRSPKSKVDGYLKEFSGMATVRSNRYFFFNTIYPNPYGIHVMFKVDSSGMVFAPDFEPVHIRIIFDTVSGNEIKLYQNRNWSSFSNIEMLQHKIEFRNVAILVPEDKDSEEYSRSRYLEISRPVVRQFDTEKEMLEKLETIEFYPYNYETLLTGINAQNSKRNKENDIHAMVRLAKRDKNPDVLYACGRSLLYGKNEECDPETAIEVLKDSALKNSHVLSKYELALCYFRGYGVAKNEKAAFRYINEALKMRYSKAMALYMLMRYEQANRPIFLSKEMQEDFLDKFTTQLNSDLDLGIMFDRFSLFSSGATVEVSPKLLTSTNNFFNLREPDAVNPYAFTEYSMGMGYAPAYLISAQQHNRNRETEEDAETVISRLLDQGTQRGDIDAAIARLFWRAQKKQLTDDDFSPKQLLKLMDCPEYHLLQFLYQNPDFPAASEIIGGGFNQAEAILEKIKSPQSAYVLGLMSISKIQGLRVYYMLPPDSAKFKQLANAAKTFPAAQYFLARAYYNNDLPPEYSKNIPANARTYQTALLLKQAVAADFLPARYLMLQIELDNISVGADKYLERIQEFCDMDYAPAFMLKAQALQKIKRVEQAKQAYREAAQKGNVDAYYELAMQTPDDTKMWQQYIMADRKRRAQDKMDFYYPQISYYEWVGNANWPQWSDEMDQKLQQEYKSLMDSSRNAYEAGQKRTQRSKDNGKVRAKYVDGIPPINKPQRKQQFIDNQL